MSFNFERVIQGSMAQGLTSLGQLTAISITNNEQAIELNVLLRSMKREIKASKENTYLSVIYIYLRTKVKEYEDTLDFGSAKGVDVLKFLMEQHGHVQADLKEVAPRSNISEILSGKRSLNLRHIQLLSKIYHVSPIVFMDEMVYA